MKYLIAILFSMTLFINPAEAQLGGLFKKQKERAAQRAKDRANQEVDNETDKAVDKAYDSVKKGLKGLFGKKDKEENKETETTEEEQVEEMIEEILEEEIEDKEDEVLVSSEIDYSPSPYVCSFDVEMELYKKGKLRKNGKITNSFVLDKDKSMLAVQTGETTSKFFFFAAKKRIYMYPGSGDMLISSKPMKVKFGAGNEDAYQITKTTDFKAIDGRNCRKYIVEAKDYTTNAWIDESVDVDFTKLMSNFGFKYDIKNSPFGSQAGEVQGIPVLAETISKNGKEKTIVHYKNYIFDDIDRSVFDISGYKVFGL